MVFCIEPMVMTDSDEYIINDNKWTVIAKNKKLTCHEEHMIYIGDHGPEILTN
jgi:methionyl aminopeptidase